MDSRPRVAGGAVGDRSSVPPNCTRRLRSYIVNHAVDGGDLVDDAVGDAGEPFDSRSAALRAAQDERQAFKRPSLVYSHSIVPGGFEVMS